MEFPTVSPKPHLYELSTHTFIINKSIDEIWDLLIKYFEDKVVWKFNNKIMQCKTVSLLDIIEFDIMIFKNDEYNNYIVEIRQMYGCRYGFNTFTDNLEKHLNLNFIYERHPIKNPPELPCESYDDNLVNVYIHILDLIKKEQPNPIRLNGYRSFGSIKKVYSKSLDEPYKRFAINTTRPEFILVLKEASRVSDDVEEDYNIRIIALASINSFIKFCKDCIQQPIWLDEINELYKKINMSETGNSLLAFEIKKGIRLIEQYNEIKLILSS